MPMANYHYLELDISDQSLLEKLEATAFAVYKCTGSQDFSIDEAKVDEILGDRSYSGGDLPLEVLNEVQQILESESGYRKRFYFEHEEDVRAFIAYLKSKGLDSKAKIVTEQVKDWNESWKKSFKEIKVNDELSIIPSWEKETSSSKGIYIYPGMGFGTGNHETTFLCLKLMLENIPELKSLKTCLDFGCGSGILGIGYCFINQEAQNVDYLDIDQEALDNCQQNIDLNESAQSVENRMFLADGYKDLLGGYDLVFANILLDALLYEGQKIIEKTNKYLIVSGLLKGQEEEVISAYVKINSSIEVVQTEYKNDWAATLLRIN